MKFKSIPKDKINSLPQKIGVYCFVGKNNKNILYIGKAINVKERVKNHYNQASFKDSFFVSKTEKIGWIETNSEIEALLLEASLIKQHKPKYNTIWKDDKNYSYATITKEKLPRVLITHRPNIDSKAIGPFVDGKSLKKVLSLLRRVFPYYVARKHPSKECSWCHINLCPGPNPNIKEYNQSLNKLALVLQGKRSSVLNALRKEMLQASKKQEFERAGRTKEQITSLERIMTNAKILDRKSTTETNWQDTEKILKKILGTKNNISRIEIYDISNIQGKMATGSMVVFIDGKPSKNYYRKFRIKLHDTPNDIAMLKETLTRRLGHPEWPMPNLILIDGGKAQLNAGLSIKSISPFIKNTKIISLAKRNNALFIEKKKEPILLKESPQIVSNLILFMRDEAHRFAITYHKKLRETYLSKRL